ncbi:MAG TPA: YceI family protein [Thermoanaerobaculia bacterium]|nr:YceI family protein [Thermoanaerobaculia bacterium]
MKYSSLFLAASLLVLPACQKSEITDKPAAQVTESAGTTDTAADTALTANQPADNAVTANVIKEKSSIDFVGAKVTRDHKGKFNSFDGTIEYVAGKPTRIAFEIDMNSIESDDAQLTGHLKSPDFFDVAKYPKATFVSTSLTEGAGGAGSPAGTTHLLRGTLDLHGVKKEVSIPVTATQNADGVRAQSEFTINRHDWGVSYKGMADDLIKDNVLIRLDLAFPPPSSV